METSICNTYFMSGKIKELKKTYQMKYGKRRGVDATLTFDPKGQIQDYKVYQFYA